MDMFSWLIEVKTSDWIAFGSFIIALFALGLSVFFQVKQAKLQRSHFRKQLHIEVLKIGLENPHFLQHEIGTFGTMNESESKSYSMYIYILLNQATLAISEGLPDSEWQPLLDKYIVVHKDYLTQMDNDIKTTFPLALRQYMGKKLPEAGWG